MDTPLPKEIPALVAAHKEQIAENLHVYVGWGLDLVSALLILIAGWVIGNWLDRRVRAVKRLDETLTGFLGGFARYTVLIIALITILGQFGVQTASLLAILGAAGLALGLALQGTLSNVAAGVMLLILRPFKVGDYISAGDTAGTVKTLGLFGTEMSTLDNVYLFVPNGQLWGAAIWNYARNPHRRQDIIIGISYGDDIAKAVSLVRSVLTDESRILQNIPDKMPEVAVDNLGDFSVNVVIRFWSKREDYLPLRWEITRAVKETFDRNGITIPFPTQISIHKQEG